MQCIPSREIALTNMHISMLKRTIPKFQAADPNCREKIVKEAADHIKGTWMEDVEFNRDVVINICDILAKLDHSQMFLAYSQILVWKSKKGREEIHFQNSKLVVLYCSFPRTLHLHNYTIFEPQTSNSYNSLNS